MKISSLVWVTGVALLSGVAVAWALHRPAGAGTTQDKATKKERATSLDPDSERNMKAFPPPEAGQVRHVLHMPKEEDESTIKVEIIVGKTTDTDGRNRHFFAGKLEAETIKGWGFKRYILKKLGPMAGTMMAVDPNLPKVSTFVTLGGEPELLRYNSRLPYVVYVPEGVEVRFRYWETSSEAQAVPRG